MTDLASPTARLATEFEHHAASPWVPRFLDMLNQWLASNPFPPAKAGFRFSPRNKQFVVVGTEGVDRLLCQHTSYLEMLLLHPYLSESLTTFLDRGCRSVAERLVATHQSCEPVARGGLAGYASLRDEIFSPQVLVGIDSMGADRPLPLGVSGSVVLQSADGPRMVVLRRNALVAVNPQIWTLPIDGGVQRLDHVDGWIADLLHEARDELPLEEANVASLDWQPIPYYPGRVEGLPGALPGVRRSGVNVLYTASFNTVGNWSAADILHEMGRKLRDRRFYETSSVGLLRLSTTDDLLEDLVDLGAPISEVLVHALVEALNDEVGQDLLAALSDGVLGETATRPKNTTMPEGVRMTNRFVTSEATLEARFAADMLRRFPRLAHRLEEAPPGLESLDEQEDPPISEVVRWVVRLLIEYRNSLASMATHNMGGIDASRLFEALVYRLTAVGFGDQARSVKGVLASMKAEEVQQAGYVSELIEQTVSDVLWDVDGDEVGERALRQAEVITGDSSGIESTRLGRDVWLLLYCSLLWAHERDRSAGAGELALGPDFQLFDITSDPLGLFFRSRAIIASPVTSIAQTNIGLQFARSALKAHPGNAGIHHTCALYYLRRASLVADGPATTAMLELGLKSVDDALLLDAVFAGFYVTKAKIQYKLGLRDEAFSNLQAAIELQRYDTGLAAERFEEWRALLDTWELS